MIQSLGLIWFVRIINKEFIYSKKKNSRLFTWNSHLWSIWNNNKACETEMMKSNAMLFSFNVLYYFILRHQLRLLIKKKQTLCYSRLLWLIKQYTYSSKAWIMYSYEFFIPLCVILLRDISNVWSAFRHKDN